MTREFDTGEEIIEIRSEDAIADEWNRLTQEMSAKKDFMTGYYNKDAFVDIVSNARKDEDSFCGLMIFEINGFNRVVNNLGRFQGDSLLMRTALIISKLYPSLCVARLCSDMFGVFVPHVQSEDEIIDIAKTLCEKVVVEKKKIRCTLTMGVSVRKTPLCEFDGMYKEASKALFYVKSTEREKFCVYNPDEVDDMIEKSVKSVDSYYAKEAIIMDDCTDSMYIIDPVSYELLYLNDAFKEESNLSDDVLGHKCYKAFGKGDKPCADCRMDYINDLDNNYWSVVGVDGKNKVIKESFSTWRGRKVKVVHAVDVSTQQKVKEIIVKSSQLGTTLKKCIDEIVGGDTKQESIYNVLGFIGEYYDAEKAVLYEASSDYHTTYIHVWNKIGRRNMSDDIDLTLEEIMDNDLISQCTNEEGICCIKDVEIFKKNYKNLYDKLHKCSVMSFMTVTLAKNSQIKGYGIIFNPVKHLYELTILITMSTYIANELVRQELWKQKTYELTHDILTGAYNRTSYIEFINEIKEAESLGYMVANIDGMKKINETMGYEYGDRIIKDTARIIKDVFVGYPVFRFESDEFIVCCADITRDEFAILVDSTKEQLKKCESNVSIGFVWDDFDIDVKRMREHAHEFVRNEKRKAVDLGTIKLDAGYERIATGLLNHISNEDFRVYLQPKINIANENCCGAEALIRLEHPEYGLLPPAKFIPILEKSRTISYVDLYVFEKVCQLLEKMNKEGKKLYPISFNFSRMTLLEKDLIDKVEEISSKYDVPKKYLEIEITESIGDMENDLIARIANGLHEKGFRLSMDDFGTKYSSISILSLMRFDILKIDRSMVSNLTENDISRKVLKHIIAMCNDLGIECIAEGVETKEQANYLRQVDCNVAQGYLYSKPITTEEFERKYVAV